MDSPIPTLPSHHPQPQGSGLIRSLAKLVRLRRSNRKPRDNANLPEFSAAPAPSFLSQSVYGNNDANTGHSDEAVSALLAVAFASISSFKASYAQLQFAQSPYDPDSIQSADRAIIAELKRLSQLKHLHLTKQLDVSNQFSHLNTMILAQIQEQQSLVKTFQITARKLELELQSKTTLISSLNQQLQTQTTINKSLSTALQTHNASELARLNPTQFVSTLQHVMRSVRAFAELLMREMKRANWDLDYAATAIEPSVAPQHRALAFEAFVGRAIFDGFHRQDFGGVLSLHPNEPIEFHREFVELNSTLVEELIGVSTNSAFGSFLKVKYEATVNPTMEEALFGEPNDGYASSRLFKCFAEMARRVWVLHRLFWSFEEVGMFVVERGRRYSEVYMTSAAAEDDGEAEEVVGFTVSPGFRVGGMVMQSRVYLERRDGRL